MKRREINPPLIQVSAPTRRRRRLVSIGLVLLLALLAYMTIDTLTRFKPAAEAIRADQAALQDKLDAMGEELTKISEAVEAWPGITEITDEPIGPLADPYAWQTEQTERRLNPLGQDPLLLRIVALEADASYEGALGVATVIFNRLEAGTWGDTLEAVLAAPGQFTTYKSTRTPPITDTTRQACQDAADGIRNLPPEVLYFCTPAAAKTSQFFKTLEEVERFGGTVWFKEVTP